jgi:hypothetical protein
MVFACEENVQSFSPEHHNGKIFSSKNDWGSLLLNPEQIMRLNQDTKRRH